MKRKIYTKITALLTAGILLCANGSSVCAEGMLSEPSIEDAESSVFSSSELSSGYEAEEGLEDLKETLSGMLSGYEGDWSVYVQDMVTDEYLVINDHSMKAASLIKLYVMGAVYEQITEGGLSASSDIDSLLYSMITVSDNDATNRLVDILSPDGTYASGMNVVNAFCAEWGYTETSQGRALMGYSGSAPSGENYTSVKDCGSFLAHIYSGTNVSQEVSDQMLNLLKNQTRTHKIPAGLPEGVVTANKTGELEDTENDAAIIFAESGDYILCVMSSSLSSVGTAQSNIANISSMVYQYFEQAGY